MIIYLFRHGETEWNKARRLQGQSDIPLNEFGRELAVKTAAALRERGISFDRAFTSPLCRARETAEILLEGTQTPLEANELLFEFNFGAGEGERFDVMKTDENHPLYNFFCRPEQYVAQGDAESFEDVQGRVQRFLQECILPLEGQCATVLVVAHGAYNRSMLNSVSGIPLAEFWKIGLPNCAASILKLENGVPEIIEKSTVFYGNPVNGRP